MKFLPHGHRQTHFTANGKQNKMDNRFSFIILLGKAKSLVVIFTVNTPKVSSQ